MCSKVQVLDFRISLITKHQNPRIPDKSVFLFIHSFWQQSRSISRNPSAWDSLFSSSFFIIFLTSLSLRSLHLVSTNRALFSRSLRAIRSISYCLCHHLPTLLNLKGNMSRCSAQTGTAWQYPRKPDRGNSPNL